MARYIDADLLLEELENNTPLNWTDSEIELQQQFDFQVFKHIIEYQPTADVVPKSEIEQIFAEIDEAIDNLRGAFLRQRISEIKREHGVSIK